MSRCPIDGLLPGVLSGANLKKLCSSGYILDVDNPGAQIDYSSIDLTLSEEGWSMPHGAIKPIGGSYESSILQKKEFAVPLNSVRGEYKLVRTKTYVFKLKERLNAAEFRQMSVYGQATAKSSIGRVDVLARLIVDGASSYESFQPKELEHSNGEMYVEITPITFAVVVKPGIPITQLRLFYGSPEEAEIRGKDLYPSVLVGGHDAHLRVDLSNVRIGKQEGCGFSAKDSDRSAPIKLWKATPLPNPNKFWDLVPASEINEAAYFPIKKNRFYILRSKEKMKLPGGVAVYCRAIDETIGEMRIHYAGFVHPFFGVAGYEKPSDFGTPLIFEVRGHDVEVLLNDNEVLARLTFYRMSVECKQKKNPDNPYGAQNLQLSKFFGPWK